MSTLTHEVLEKLTLDSISGAKEVPNVEYAKVLATVAVAQALLALAAVLKDKAMA